MNFNSCSVYEGLYHVHWVDRGMDYCEYDSKEAWPWLVDYFDADINTIVDLDNEWGGISWKEGNQILKSTPKNVFEWAVKQEWLKRL